LCAKTLVAHGIGVVSICKANSKRRKLLPAALDSVKGIFGGSWPTVRRWQSLLPLTGSADAGSEAAAAGEGVFSWDASIPSPWAVQRWGCDKGNGGVVLGIVCSVFRL
jgi:hypothetical protein